MDNYYLLSTGRIVSESDINMAFEIATGLDRNDNVDLFERWKRALLNFQIILETIQPSKHLIECCVKNGQMVKAVMLFRYLYGGTLAEVKDKVYKIKEEMEKNESN